MKISLSLCLVFMLVGCANPRDKQNHSFFGGKHGELSEAAEPEKVVVERSEREFDTGFGVTLTPPKGWTASKPDADLGVTVTSPNKSVVFLEVLKDGGELGDEVEKWHQDFGKLASDVLEPLGDATLAGNAGQMAKYQFLIDDAVVSRTVWEIPHDGRLYRIHVRVADVSDRYETQTILDTLRFVPPTNIKALNAELLSASIANTKLDKSRFGVSGWQKVEPCEKPSCIVAYSKEDAVITLFRQDFASEAAAKRDLPLRVAMLERTSDGSSRAAKYGKNNGHLISNDAGRTWVGQFGKSIWTVVLDSPPNIRSFDKAHEKSIAAAQFK